MDCEKKPELIGPLLGYCNHRAYLSMDKKLRRYGVTPIQCRTLTYLHRQPGPVTQKQLQQHLAVKPSTVNGIVDRLEKAGLLKNGKQCSPDEMFEILFHRRPKYSYTKDAAEQILLYMANTTRVNDGLSELPTLPPDMRLRDDLGEFAEEPDEQEKESYKELGIVKMPPVKEK